MAVMNVDNIESKLEMLKWISEKNTHIPLAELAFLLDIPASEEFVSGENVYDWH